MISAITGWNNVEGHLVLGSIVSLFATISVAASYIMIVPWRKHPSVLILYRTITSMIFSICIILDSINNDVSDGRGFAFVTEFSLLLGECWLTTIAIDLVHSLTNPFISYRYNLQRFQMYNTVFALLVSIIFFFHRDCQGAYESIMWIRVDSGAGSPCLWGYYCAWILLMYSYQLWATVFAYNRLRKGLSSSFDIRKQCANDTFKCLSVYAVYLSFLVLCFIIVSSNPNPDPKAPINNFALVLLFFIANRGSVDAIAWFMLHDFIRSDHSSVAIPPAPMDEEMPVYEEGEEDVEAMRNTRSRTLSVINIQESMKDISKGMSKGINEIASATIAEFDEADLSPQVNIALRQQVVQYVTLGVKEAITNPSPPPLPKSMLQEFSEIIYQETDFAAIDGMEVKAYLLDNLHPFKAFAPNVFSALRREENISDERYLKTLQSTANERLSEGASGAFMFFCGGGEYIVKTIRDREARVLHSSLKKYAKYLKTHKNSLLCRFLGSYSLNMYEQTFYFVVMLNCFDHKAKINERYDIKGSWVGRSADPVKPTKKVVCRHCNEMFIPAAKEQCTVMVGRHEASVVLKDNDLRNRISLRSDEAKQVVAILKKDSDLLGELGVLDYSLLIGVKKGKFEIKENGIVRELSAPEFHVSSSGLGEETTAASASPAGSISGTNHRSCFRANQVIGPSIYHFGIVDFLQDWTFEKEMERNFKIYMNRKDPDGISVMEPIAYKLRFQNKMDQIFAVDEDNLMALSPASHLDSHNAELIEQAVARSKSHLAVGGVVNPMFAIEEEPDEEGRAGRAEQEEDDLEV